METIFDHDVTDAEQKVLFGIVMTKEDYIGDGDLIEDELNCHIYRLLMIRGQKEAAQKYLDKLPNDEFKLFSLTNVDH